MPIRAAYFRVAMWLPEPFVFGERSHLNYKRRKKPVTYDLKSGLGDEFVYAASGKVPYRPPFWQEADGVSNAYPTPPEGWDNYQYVSAVLKEPLRLPMRLAIETRFDAYGAPLVVFSEGLTELPDGRLQYATHYEAVLYEGGINLWKIVPQEADRQQVTALCKAKLPFPANVWTRLTVEITREGIVARAGDLTAQAACTLPQELFVGFTACEGINHFRVFEAEACEEKN